MCGICGLANAGGVTPADIGLVRAMNRSMVHRGPDGEGEFLPAEQARVMLAMRRLSIIDLTGGWQPLYNEDRSLAVVCNGEIYNHVELRRDLLARGHRFATGSDCETIVHLYEDHGLDFVRHLRGMYAFALWDERRRRLILGRDRMGEKPLYLREEGGRLTFASELRSLLAGGHVPFRLDPGAVALYYHYAYVPEPRTAVEGVRKLPAGHLLIVDVEPWKVEERRYWSMEDAPALTGDPVKVIREELERVGELIVRSDVPVGVALSGGIDSSLVAAIAARRSPGQIHALTVGYEGRPRQDERAMAERFARHLKMPFHDVEVRTEDVLRMLPERAVWRDDPIADPAAHGYWAVSRLARDLDIPVMLQGQGGDELFWGYGWVRRAVELSQRKEHDRRDGPSRMLNTVRGLFPRDLSRNGLRNYAYALGGLAQGWKQVDPDHGQPGERLVFYNLTESYQMGAYAVRRVFTPAFSASVRGVDPGAIFDLPRPWPDVSVAITRLICGTYLIENGMAQGDRLSMASSVELRLPLCDYRLVETVIGLRKANPDAALPPKAWLRAVASELLPEWVLTRPKRGFTPPGQMWMHRIVQAYSAGIADGYLVAKGILDPGAAREMARPHSRLSAWEDIFYKTLVLEYWARGVSASAAPREAVPELAAAHR